MVDCCRIESAMFNDGENPGPRERDKDLTFLCFFIICPSFPAVGSRLINIRSTPKTKKLRDKDFFDFKNHTREKIRFSFDSCTISYRNLMNRQKRVSSPNMCVLFLKIIKEIIFYGNSHRANLWLIINISSAISELCSALS